MPEVSRTEIGRRLFLVHKDKGVENAIKKVRRGLGQDWTHLSEDDIAVLKRMLGECWVYMDRPAWEKIAFSRLAYSDVAAIVRIGDSAKGKDSTDTRAIDDVIAILMGMV
jgi:hypothetical protein